jgi:hypothetical protein
MTLKPSIDDLYADFMDSLEFHPGLPCPTLQRPAGGPTLKRPPAGRAPCGRLLPLWTPRTVRLRTSFYEWWQILLQVMTSGVTFGDHVSTGLTFANFQRKSNVIEYKL